MIGLSILLAVVLYVWLARFVARRIANRAAKYTVIAIFILIPTWDVIPGKLYFNHLCENEAGLKIYKTVEGVEGYRGYPNTSGLVWQALGDYGYRFVEIGDGNQLYRYTLDSSGQVIKQEISESMARYGVDAEIKPLLWNVRKVEEYVFDQRTKERLALRTTFSAHGNWLQVIFGPYLGGAASCQNPLPTSKDLLLNTLKPTKFTN
ncbi:MAG: hypothetical protein HY272_02835 [Gammaproteobacteria bacterium]|nr:hypothetical protein [Gammaproteobacteria bacterium]